MGIVSMIKGVFVSPLSIKNDSVHFEVVRNQKTGQSSLSVAICASTGVVEQLEPLLKTQCYKLIADHAASEAPNTQGAVVFNLPKRQ